MTPAETMGPPGAESSAARAGQAALSDALRVSFRLLRWIMIFLAIAYLASGIFLVFLVLKPSSLSHAAN